MSCHTHTCPLRLLARLNIKFTPILLLSVLTANIIAAGCSYNKRYPKDWPKQVAISPSICPALVGSYSDMADIDDINRVQVTIAMPSEEVLKYEYRMGQMIIRKEYCGKDNTLICSENNALLEDGIEWDIYDGGLISKKRRWALSKDRNGYLILERKDALTFWFLLFFPMFKYSENYWYRYAPINDIYPFFPDAVASSSKPQEKLTTIKYVFEPHRTFTIEGTSIKEVKLDVLAGELAKYKAQHPDEAFELWAEIKCTPEESAKIIEAIQKAGITLKHFWVPRSFFDPEPISGPYGSAHKDILSQPKR